jgi:hypothetical protein
LTLIDLRGCAGLLADENLEYARFRA